MRTAQKNMNQVCYGCLVLIPMEKLTVLRFWFAATKLFALVTRYLCIIPLRRRPTRSPLSNKKKQFKYLVSSLLKQAS